MTPADLPPLPNLEQDIYEKCKRFVADDVETAIKEIMQAYARLAIEADRKKRGETRSQKLAEAGFTRRSTTLEIQLRGDADEQQAEPVANLHDNKTDVTEPHPMLEPTHVCKDCGAGWRQCDDFSFNLRSEKACPACDNTPVGGQLVSITAPLIREVNTLRQSLRAYRVLRLAIGAMMAPLGYHGTISARDDRVQSVMDALAQIDAEDRR